MSIIADLVEVLEEADNIICTLCKKVNPQHKECTVCEERETIWQILLKAKQYLEITT